ncbi:ATP-binding protein [Nonomuraea sp. NPDC050556]|uniref:ATP-binding protein n=1 Tax=Nonomuraea sp. NPDC050556 TaxID=3364369 RepID=UPI00379D9F40
MIVLWVVLAVVVVYGVAVRRTAGTAGAVALGFVVAAGVAAGVAGWRVRDVAGSLLLAAGVAAVVWALGRWRRRVLARRDALTVFRSRAEAVPVTAAGVERLRLAGALHDTAAHRLTGIVVSAASALRLGSGQEEVLSYAAGEGRLAVQELSALTVPGVVRLADLDALAGPGVVYRRTVDEARGEVAAVAYRVVREALTNASRYAPGAEVSVDITSEDGDLVVTVTNGEPSAPSHTLGTGRGLAGLRTAVAACGGTLTTGPRPTGPLTTGPRPSEPRPSEARPMGLRPSEPRPSEARPSEPRRSADRPTQARPTGPHPTETRPTEARPMGDCPSEARATGPLAMEPPRMGDPTTGPVPAGSLASGASPQGGWEVVARVPLVVRRDGREEGWRARRAEGWRGRRGEGWRARRAEGWRGRREEGWWGWRGEGWRDGRGEGWRGRRGADWALVALAVGLSVGTSLLDDVPSDLALLLPLSTLHALPLAWRRRAPGWGLAVALAIYPVMVVARAAPPAGDVFLWCSWVELALLYAIGLTRKGAVAVLGVAAVGGLALAAGPGIVGNRLGAWAVLALGVAVPAALAWGLGAGVGGWRARLAVGEARARTATGERAAAAVQAERERVAAGLRRTAVRQAEAVVTAAEAGRLADVLAEARAGLATLRDLLEEMGETAEPAPTLAGVAALASSRGAVVRMVGERRELDPATEVAVFRVAERLLEHADEVTVSYLDGGLTVAGMSEKGLAKDASAGTRAKGASAGTDGRGAPAGTDGRGASAGTDGRGASAGTDRKGASAGTRAKGASVGAGGKGADVKGVMELVDAVGGEVTSGPDGTIRVWLPE